ncbi:MAG: insulinase family protein [Kofleriaceae bacterium]
MKRILLALLVACGGSQGPTPMPPPPPPAETAQPAPPPAPADPSMAKLPLAADVKEGKLANGLTYIIRKHGKPEKRARLWLAVNAGGTLEDDDQDGLAHFDEHMSFNGTKRFPKQDIVNYLQSIGMRFGADLNAYTNQDETVYQLEVPTDNADYLGKGFDILRDWAGDATYDDKEVKSESGVVLEEWRLGRGAQARLYDKHAKVLFKGTRYATRNVIGNPDILRKADRAALYRFYKDWYRPDNMAVIAVGDFEPSQIEEMIKERFGDLKNPANERPKTKAGVPKAEGTRISIESDKELPNATISIHNFVPSRGSSTLHDYQRDVIESVYAHVINERFAVLRRRSDAPFQFAGSSMGKANRETDDFNRFVVAKNGKLDDAMRMLMTESARIDRHGITQPELDRAKADLSRGYDATFDRHATVDSRQIVAELVRHFLTGESVLMPEEERDLQKKLLAGVTVNDVNADVRSFGGADNRAIEISIPEGQDKPTEAKVKQIIADVEHADIGEWKEEAIPTALMTTPPKPGKITKEKTFDKIGVTVWTLSNGATVIVKPTDFEKDTVVFSADSPGGTAQAKDADFLNARFASAVAALGGVGDYDSDTLDKILTGKRASVGASIGEVSEGLSGSASPKDLETMFQLAYLRVTAPRKDVDQFKLWQANTSEQVANQARSPEYQYVKQSTDFLYKSNPRRVFPAPEDFGKVDQDKALAFYKDRFGDVADFNFVIVGEVDLVKLRPLVETYLASMPSKGRKEKEKDLHIRKIAGKQTKEFDLGVEPKASVSLDFHGDETWSLDKERDIYVLGQVLSNFLREDLREDKGGVYGVGANGTVQRSPYGYRTFGIQFGCDPKRVQELVKAATDDIATIAKQGIDDAHIDKIKQMYTRGRETDLRTNRFWATRLAQAFKYGDDPNDIPDTQKTIARMTAANIKASAKRYLTDSKNLYQAIRMPKSDQPAEKK